MKKSLLWYLRTIQDPRIWRKKIYELDWVLVIVICGTLTGKKTIVDIADWARAEQEWLKNTFGIMTTPSHDTIGRILASIMPQDLTAALGAWTKESLLDRTVTTLAIDGKTLRGSRDENWPATHIVSAWAREIGLVIAAEPVPYGCSEPKAIKMVLQRLILSDTLQGKLVTIDAIATRRDIAALILSGGGDYLFTVKENNHDLLEELQYLFDDATKNNFKDVRHTTHHSAEKGHGRIDRRYTVAIHDVAWLSTDNQWIGLRTLIMTRRERERNGKTSISTAYHISSLAADAERFAGLIRGHWSIENNLHRTLDMSFGEDASRVRIGFAARNLNAMRCISLGMLLRETSLDGTAAKIRAAATRLEYRNRLAQPLFM